MSLPFREHRVAETVLALTDTPVPDRDLAGLLAMLTERAVELLDVAAAVVLLADGYAGRPVGPRGLVVAAASSGPARWLETFGVELASGPSVDCVRTGRTVTLADGVARNRWPRVATAAAEAGFRAVHALPMRRREQTVGALTLLRTDARVLQDEDRRLAGALADAATLGLLHQRGVRKAESVAALLRTALTHHVVDEDGARSPEPGRSVTGAVPGAQGSDRPSGVLSRSSRSSVSDS